MSGLSVYCLGLSITLVGRPVMNPLNPSHVRHYLAFCRRCRHGSCVTPAPHCMSLRACCCSGSKQSSDSNLPNLNRTISSNLLIMALPFIVGPHQCSLTQGPEGRPQVEVVLRIRPPLAEFLMLSSSHLRNSARCFSKQGRGLPQLLQPGQGRSSDNRTQKLLSEGGSLA